MVERWRKRPLQSWLIRAAGVVLPVAAAVGAGIVASLLLPEPHTLFPTLGWWAVVIGASLAAMWLVAWVAKRFLPLAVLLQMSLAFPDQAPSRFRLAVRSWSTRKLTYEVNRVRLTGLPDDATDATAFLLTLVAALGSHDAKTRGHAERTRAYAEMIADEMHLSTEDRDRLRWTSLLHDVGKLAVPTAVLGKDDMLDDLDWHHVVQHPRDGYELTRPLHQFLGDWALGILHHHERWDGTGYPAGLAGEEISLAARIVAVADAFDAMTAARTYQRPRSAAMARKELAYRAGTQFDPAVVRAFLNISVGRLRWSLGPLALAAELPFIGGLRRLGDTAGLVAGAMAGLALFASAGFIQLPGSQPGADAVTAAAEGATTGEATVLAEQITAPAAVVDVAGAVPNLDPTALSVVDAPAGVEVSANDDGTITVRPPSGYVGPVAFAFEMCSVVGNCATADVVLEFVADGSVEVVSAPPRFAVTGPDGRVTTAVAPLAAPDTTATTTPPTSSTTTSSTTTTTTTVAAAGTPTTQPPPATTAPPTTATTTTLPPTTTTVPATTTTVLPTTTIPATTTTLPPTTTTVPPTTTTLPPTTTTTTLPNTPPIAVDDGPISTPEDVAVTIAVLANDVDEDPASLVVTINRDPGSGTAVVVGQSVLYTPNPDFVGGDDFSYQICDLAAACATATVTVVVTDVNDPPIANDDTASVRPGGNVNIPVLDNDEDPDLDRLMIIAVDTTATVGTVDCTLGDSTRCLYTAPDFEGVDSYVYTVSDGNGGTATATVTITIA